MNYYGIIHISAYRSIRGIKYYLEGLVNVKALFNALEKTVNKSVINDFRAFISKFSGVSKWFMCSDYCIGDKDKPNDVITFVIYPYIMGFPEWSTLIESMQKTDLKKCRKISQKFCQFSHEGMFFSFNFIVEKKSYPMKWNNIDTLRDFVDQYINMINQQWKNSRPDKIELYCSLEKELKQLKICMNRKNFNCKLLTWTTITVILASYIKYILCREIPYMEIFAWFPDRDKMTSCYDSIYGTLYSIISHCLCENHLPEEKFIHIIDCIPANAGEEIFYDEFVRVADFICGCIATFNLQTRTVDHPKHCTLIEDVIADNDNIVILCIQEKGVARISHTKKGKP